MKIDYDSEAGDRYMRAVRSLHKAGLRPEHWRLAFDAQEAETARAIRARVEASVFGYEPVRASPLVLCQYCHILIADDEDVSIDGWKYTSDGQKVVTRAHHRRCM